MNNLKNPYVALLHHMRDQGAAYNPPSIEFGIVNTIDPLEIVVGELPLKKENLLIADDLKKGYKRQITIPSTNATGSTSEGSINSIGIPNCELDFTDGFNKDDVVALIQVSDKKYLILCRVVEA